MLQCTFEDRSRVEIAAVSQESANKTYTVYHSTTICFDMVCFRLPGYKRTIQKTVINFLIHLQSKCFNVLALNLLKYVSEFLNVVSNVLFLNNLVTLM